MIVFGPIAVDSLPAMSWKNGGGTTRTLVIEPQGAGLDHFLWRISLAEVHASGGFSKFVGVDRTILLWRGEGMVLRSPAWPVHALTEHSLPFVFRGEDEVTCELLGEVTEDLNLMVRRDVAVATLNVETRKVRLPFPCSDIVVFCALGRIDVMLLDRRKFALEAGQFLRISEVHSEITIAPDGAMATFFYAIVCSPG